MKSRSINFVRTRAADIAEAERILDQIRKAENGRIKFSVAPLTVSEAIDKLEVEAAEVAAEIDHGCSMRFFAFVGELPIPYVRMDGQAGKIILALSMDRIRKAGEAVVDADDAMSKTDREKKVAELTKSIEKHRPRIARFSPARTRAPFLKSSADGAQFNGRLKRRLIYSAVRLLTAIRFSMLIQA